MALEELVNKYKEDSNELRLTILLETYGKKATKKNIDAVKLLILDNDMDMLTAFLGESPQSKEDAKRKFEESAEKQLLEESRRPPNEDDFNMFVLRQFGNPEDPNSLGNRILSGQTYHWHMRTHIKPDVLLQRFAMLAKKPPVEVDYYANFKTGIYECAIAGTVQINKNPMTRVSE